MTEHKSLVFRFDDVEVREREFLLIKAGAALPVEPKAFRVLLFLLRNPGRLVTKDEILGAVWNDCAVSDNSLTRSIAHCGGFWAMTRTSRTTSPRCRRWDTGSSAR